MDYDKLLNNFNELIIMINDDVYYLLESSRHRSKYLDFIKNMFYGVFADFNHQDLLYISVTRSGLKIDFSALKKAYSELFEVPLDDNFADNIVAVAKKMQRTKELPEKVNKHFMKTLRGNPIIGLYDDKSLNNIFITMEKEKRIANTYDSIMNLKKLCENEEDYSNVPNIFNEDKVGLSLAYLIVNHLKLSKEVGREDKVLKDLVYLREYLSNNKDLIESGYAVPIFGKKPYMIAYVNSVVKANSEKKVISTDKNIERHNYSFFECDEVKSREILDNLYEHSFYGDNTPDLKEILKRKISFYEDLDFTNIKIGKDSFDGYIGFELPEGFVILDKFYDDIRRGIIARDNAIYIVSKGDFRRITKMSKTEAIEAINSKKINAKRIIHSGEYEDKVKEYTKTK